MQSAPPEAPIPAPRRGLLKRFKLWVYTSPAWAISISLHLIVALIAGLVYFERFLPVEEGVVDVSFGSRKKVEPPKSDKAQEAPAEADANIKEEADAQQSLADELAAESANPFGAGDSDKGGGPAPLGVVVEGGGGRPVGYGARRRARGGGPREEKPIEEPEDGVRAGLRWLARHQSPDGSWSVTDFPRNCGRFGHHGDCTCGGLPGSPQFQVGVTALALLAFLGKGHLPSSPEPVLPQRGGLGELTDTFGGREPLTYGLVVKRGLRYLVRSQSPSGLIGPEADRFMYNHLIASMALSEAAALTGVDFVRESAERAVAYLAAARSPEGGWRYTARPSEGDSSVTGWAVLALHSAGSAGIAVDRAAIADARRWLEGMTRRASIDPRLLGDPPSAKRRVHLLTGYLGPSDAGKLVTMPGLNDDSYYNPSSTSVTVIAAALLDRELSGKAARAIDTLLAFPPPRFPFDEKSRRAVDFYYWYHATYALLLATGGQGDRWREWSAALGPALLGSQNLKEAEGQCAEGSWDPIDRWSCEGGRVYATAMAALTLEVHHRYPQLLATGKRGPRLDVR
jgi:hypothetical protein